MSPVETAIMSPEALEILRKRAEAHAAACIELENDPLIRDTFGPFEPLKPIKSPMRSDWMFRRQAD